MSDNDINCSGCTTCCKQDNIFLRPDEMSKFQWHFESGRPVLNRKENGNCIYLSDKGCSVYEQRPVICSRFRCDTWYKSKTKSERKELIRQNPNNALVFAKGKKMVRILREKI